MGRILYDISQDYMGVIQKSRLFSGIEPDEANGMSKCLEITFREYDKEEVIFNEGANPILGDGGACPHLGIRCST